MDSKAPLISILTVVYNRRRFVRRAIESVVTQDFDDFEYVVVDGGSTDGTLEIIREFEDRIDDWISEPDAGLYFALNKGISRTTGQYIGIVHADDFLLSNNVLSRVAKEMSQVTAGIFHGNALAVVECPTFSTFRQETSSHAGILKSHNHMVHPASFVKRSVYDQVGCYDTQYRYAADYEFFIRCVIAGIVFHHTDQMICGINQSDSERVSNTCNSHLEAYRFHKQHRTGNHNQYLRSYLNCRLRRELRKRLPTRPRRLIRRVLGHR